ncbi:MAG TPA: PhzF family phenazine biosynthesis protein [Vicinamibacteria bacterium]|nr:PhzF family phenazine biosynthesis protein [Vicinamibacteria bacterium]
MRLPIFQVDAFTSQVFRGNPAAVCPLESWLDDATLQSIAAENNVSETAFYVGGDGTYEIRWMTPAQEVDLCGHATLASAFVLFGGPEQGREEVVFRSKSGDLKVRREGDLITLDFPSRPPRAVTASDDLLEGLGRAPREVWAARDYLAVYDREEDVRALSPDMARLLRLDQFAVIVTAPGSRVDFVSRFFAPRAGIDEDPVTGSAHCTLVPFWSKRLGKKRLHALQVSARGGELFCEDRGERVAISGRAVRYLEGTIEV